MAATTDFEYNDSSREIHMRYDIYFNAGGAPLVVTRDNYLVSSTGLEESQSETDTALGAVSSNEITFDLLNEDGRFTPTNPSSPYYGRIKKGVRVDVYGRAAQDDPNADWDSLGTYYVKDWSTSTGGLIAAVTAYDKMYDILNAPQLPYKIAKDKSVKAFFSDFFSQYSTAVSVDSSITAKLPYAYINQSNKEFITALTNGSLALCFGNRSGGVTVLNRLTRRDLRATLSDADQVVSIDTKQTLNVGYDGASVVCNAPYESIATELLTLKNQEVPVGVSTISSLDFTDFPAVRVLYATTNLSDVTVRHIDATSHSCELTINNKLEHAATVDIVVYGSKIELTSSTLADNGSDLLSLDSPYVQTTAQATTCKAYLRKFVVTPTPMLSVSVRGNFKLQIGDKVRIVSEKYNTDFTGVIIRSEYKYDGGLKGTLTLIDASLFGG